MTGKNWDAHAKKMEKVPWPKKLRKTGIGIGAIALGLGIEKFLPHIDDKVLYALLIFGGYSIAGDLVRGAVGYATAAIRDIKAALKEG